MGSPRELLGRSVIVNAGGDVPSGWEGCREVLVDDRTIDDPASTVEMLHEIWLGRIPAVVRLAVDPTRFREPSTITADPHSLDPGVELWTDRLHHLVWSNSYDARDGGDPRWWWGVKASRLSGVTEGGPADVLLPDGTPAWIDGGPRGSAPAPPTGVPVVHAESVDLGVLNLVPAPTALRSDLAPDQLAAVTHPSGPARIIAPAGSGKTRVLTERLRHVVVDRGFEREVVRAVAFNVRAKDEMRARLDGIGARIETINALGRWVLQEAAGGHAPPLLDEWKVRRVVERLVDLPKHRHRANTDPYGPYLEGLSRIRLALRDPDLVEAEIDDTDGLAERVWPQFRAALRREGGIDFDDQIYGAVEVLLRDGALRRRLQRSCRHLLVDEFQDLTPAHVLLVRLLAGPTADVFGVGDDDQTIYGYTGASPEFLVRFERYFPGATAYALEVNYRCPTVVVERAATLLGWNRFRVPKQTRPGPAADPDPAAVKVVLHPPEEAAREAVNAVRVWIEGGAAASSVAVLARVNALLLAPTIALRSAGVPVASELSAAVLERTGTRAALAYLRLASAPERMAGADVVEILRRPSRGSLPPWLPDRLRRRSWSTDGLRRLAGELLKANEEETLLEIADDLEAVTEAALVSTRSALAFVRDRVGLGQAMGLLDASKGAQSGAGGSHLDDIEALIQLADLHPEAAGFEPWLREHLAAPPDERGVALATVHRVKGQEWDNVVVFGVSEGILPHRLSADVEEERRILHVAITRARRRVVVLGDGTRPSPFVDQLTTIRPAGPPERAERPERPERPERRRPTADQTAPAGDQNVAAALKAWRLDKSRRQSKPAFVFLTDATIEELARRQPSNAVQLRRVRGIGPAKLEDYGDEILEVIADALSR